MNANELFGNEAGSVDLQEVGDYVVEIRRYVETFTKTFRKAKMDVAKEYKKLIHYMKMMEMEIGVYGPIEHVDVSKIIIDPTCTAWRRALHGAKTVNSKELLCIEEKWLKVEKSTEDRKIPEKSEMVSLAGTLENKTPEEKAHVKDLIKHS